MTNKRLIIIFLFVFLVFVAGAVVINRIQPEEKTAIISVNGKKVKEIDLNKDDTFDLKTDRGQNKITVKDGEIFVAEADCSDKLCMRHGSLKNKYDAIVCLPNKVVMEYKDADDTIAVTGR